MGRAIKGGVYRTTVSVPRKLRKRMLQYEAVKNMNWSRIACVAWEAHIGGDLGDNVTEKVALSPIDQLTAEIKSLREVMATLTQAIESVGRHL